MAYSNITIEGMIATLEKYLDRRDMLGFAAAKNINILKDASREYLDLKNELIQKYGEQMTSDDGMPIPSFRLEVGTEGFDKYMEEIEVFANAESEPNIFKVDASAVVGILTGTEILEIMWMIEG